MLKKRKRVTEPEARYFMKQLLDALQYMHGRRVIHRDLKLGNLFLTGDMQLRIGDFGLATVVREDGERKKYACDVFLCTYECDCVIVSCDAQYLPPCNL